MTPDLYALAAVVLLAAAQAGAASNATLRKAGRAVRGETLVELSCCAVPREATH